MIKKNWKTITFGVILLITAYISYKMHLFDSFIEYAKSLGEKYNIGL